MLQAVDRDHSGEISVDEYKLFFECLGLNETDAVLAFRAIDTNADGKINIKEFTKHGRDFFLTEDPMRISKYFWGPLVDHWIDPLMLLFCDVLNILFFDFF